MTSWSLVVAPSIAGKVSINDCSVPPEDIDRLLKYILVYDQGLQPADSYNPNENVNCWIGNCLGKAIKFPISYI